ncbi:hypothetical protein quinque_002272 [Culex quinquefasciatus]
MGLFSNLARLEELADFLYSFFRVFISMINQNAAQYDQERERHSTTSTDNPVSVEVNYGGGAIPSCVNVSTPLDPGMQSALMPGTLTIVPHRTMEKAPLKKALVPSCLLILTQQSSVFLYMMPALARPDCNSCVVERFRDDTGQRHHNLCNTPRDEDRGVFRVGQHSLGGVEAVDDDTLHGHVEATVQINQTVGLDGLLQAVDETVELALLADAAYVSAQTGTGKVQRVEKAQRGGSGGTTGSEVTQEVTPELGVLVDAAQEDLFVHILKGEVERLGREVPNDVGEVPLQNAPKPCSFGIRTKQSTIPLYCLSAAIFCEAAWNWSSSLTRSIGATAAEIPPARKSLAKP